MPKQLSSKTRRVITAKRKELRNRRIIMRTCQNCTQRGSSCIVTKDSLRCTECDKFNRKCNLAPPDKELDKVYNILDDLNEQINAVRMKELRLKKQRRHWLRRTRELGDLEAKNILELEADKAKEALEGQPETPVTGSAFFGETFADPALLTMSPGAFDEFLRGLSPGAGGTVIVSSGSLQGVP